MNLRKSATHPLQIATLSTTAGSRIGMTFCPGKRDLAAMTGPWDRDFHADLKVLNDWGATAFVTLMEAHELEQLGVSELGQANNVDRYGMVPPPDSRRFNP